MSLEFNLIQFNSIQFTSIVSISTHLNSIQLQFKTNVKLKSIRFKTVSIKFNFNPLQFNWISIQFNWIQNQIQHQFWSIHVDAKTISFQQTNSISNQFDSLRCNFNFNSQHFKSTYHCKSMSIQSNSTQFRFYSIQFHEKLIFWDLEGPPPTASRKLQFLKRICNQKIMIFRRPPDLDFSDFSGGQKTHAFFITKTIDFDRFLVEIWES